MQNFLKSSPSVPTRIRPGLASSLLVLAITVIFLLPNLAFAQATQTDEQRSRWAFQFGVGIISDANLTDYISGHFNDADGDSAGVTYNFTFSYLAGELNWKIGNLHLRPELEFPLMLTLVDEQSTSLFADYNAAALLRWHNWPWDHYLDTSVGIGVGVSYSTEIWRIDEERHPGEDRANLKFTLPIDITFALPNKPNHQLSLFIDHQSGGHITDNGGVDALGIGYRFYFD